MAGFLFRLETADGAPADPPTFATAVPNWSLSDTIPLGQADAPGDREERRRRRPTAGVDRGGRGWMSH
jgi:hypothetical protein